MQYRKLAAVAGTALMAGLSLAGAALAATNVGDVMSLGKPSDSTQKFPLFVVGKDAKSSDVASALNIAVRMAAESKTTTGAAATTTTVAFDGVTHHLEPGQSFGLSASIENAERGLKAAGSTLYTALVPKGKTGGTEADFLKSGTITISGTDYKWRETVNVTNSTDVRATWDTSSGVQSQDYYKELVLKIASASKSEPRSGIFYTVKFEDKNITVANLKGKTVHFLGKDYVVQDVKTDSTKILLAESGATRVVLASDKFTVGTKTVEVTSVDITNNKVTAKVTDAAGSSASDTIDAGSSSTVNGVNVAVISGSVGEAYTASGTKTGTAKIVASETAATKEIKDGSQYDGDWYGVLTLGSSPASVNEFGIYYQKARTASDALKSGGKIEAPDKFFSVKYDGIEEYTKTGTINLQAETGQQIDTNWDGTGDGYTIKLSEAGGTKVFSLTGSGTNSGTTGSAEVAEVWLQPVSSVTSAAAEKWFFTNSSGGKELTGGTAPGAPTIVYTEKSFGGLNFNATTPPTPNGATMLQDAGASNEGPGIITIQEPATATNNAVTGQFTIEYQNSTAGLSRRFNTTVGSTNQTTYLTGPATASDDTLSYVTWNTSLNLDADGSAVGGVWLARSGTSAATRTGFVSPYGSKLVSASESSVKIEVPKSQRGLKLRVGQEGGTKTTTTGGTVSVVPVTADIAKLDSELTADEKKANDLIVVGGPCVNTIAADLLGATYPTCSEAAVAKGIPKDAALIQVFSDKYATGKVAVLVAGYEAANTDAAARALQGGLVTGNASKATVTGTSMTVSELKVA